MRLALSVALSVLPLSFQSALAEPPPCRMWQAAITCLDVIKKELGSDGPCVESGPDDEFVTDHTYRFNKAVHQKTPQAACDMTAQYNRAGYDGSGAHYVKETGECYFKDAMGQPESTLVFEVNVTLDRMCSFNVKGPFTNQFQLFLSGFTTPLDKKTGNQPEKRIKPIQNATLYSQMVNRFVNTPAIYGGEYDLNDQRPLFLTMNRFFNNGKLVSSYPRGGQVQFLNDRTNHPLRASVHHIIPAKDSHNCPCGANDLRNAALIPRAVDTSIGNNGSNAILRQIINEWRVPD